MINANLDRFRKQFPNALYFDDRNHELIIQYLIDKKLIDTGSKDVLIEKPGAGNMNFVRRVKTGNQSVIIKQCRPWVEKYPQIDAPVNRQVVEFEYYRYISSDKFFSLYSPEILAYDKENLILVIEDLGHGADFTFSYGKKTGIDAVHLHDLFSYLNHLHNKQWRDVEKANFPLNMELRKLNHEHIFLFPYMTDHGFDLDTVQPGLQGLALLYKKDDHLKHQITELGKYYLKSGPTLIHGDYYPGSWLKVNNKVKVIDPEFAFFGYAEFDLGVMAAHLFMSGMNTEQVRNTLQLYKKNRDFDNLLFTRFCGTEMLRRIIGLAQLPLDMEIPEKSDILELAKKLVIAPETINLL